MSLVDHAKREFEVLGWPGDDEMQEMICNNILEMLEVFDKQGHSGSSAAYAIGLLKSLINFDPISPLTGEDGEWIEVGDGIYQNNRDGEVFKENGEAYWIHGKIFRDSEGLTYTNKDSFVPVVFPWTKPESEIVDR